VLTGLYSFLLTETSCAGISADFVAEKILPSFSPLVTDRFLTENQVSSLIKFSYIFIELETGFKVASCIGALRSMVQFIAAEKLEPNWSPRHSPDSLLQVIANGYICNHDVFQTLHPKFETGSSKQR